MTNLTFDLLKNPILLWKHPTIAHSFTLKVGKEQLIGFVRTDKKGEFYWKFQEWDQDKELKEIALNAIEKFQLRQQKAQDYEPNAKDAKNSQ